MSIDRARNFSRSAHYQLNDEGLLSQSHTLTLGQRQRSLALQVNNSRTADSKAHTQVLNHLRSAQSLHTEEASSSSDESDASDPRAAARRRLSAVFDSSDGGDSDEHHDVCDW